MAPEILKENKMFGGLVRKYKHASDSCGCDMTFSVFLPPREREGPAPILLWLSGLTCNDDNFTQKAGAQRLAAEKGIALVAPDTSPRGLNVPGEDEGWDLGTGAGFYVDATQEPWVTKTSDGGKESTTGYKMFSYVTLDLIDALKQVKEVDTTRMSVCGHSMGGHGALVLALKIPGMFRSVSAFSPICNPIRVPWGKKAFSSYLGCSGEDPWEQYDACELIKAYSGERSFDVLVDVGTSDEFLEEQLKPESLEEASSSSKKISVKVNRREGYDHSYFFVASFIDDHVEHAAKALFAKE